MNKCFRRGLAIAGISAAAWMIAAWLPDASVYAGLENMMQEEDLPIGGNTGDPSSLFTSLLKVIFVLIVIIGLIYALVKFLARKNQVLFGRRSVRVLSGVQLAPNKTLQIVEIGGAVYILGVGEDVRLLDKIADPELAKAIVHQFQADDTNALSPALGEWFKKLNLRKKDREEHAEQPSFQDIFRERLNQASGDNRKVDDILAVYEQDEKERSNQ